MKGETQEAAEDYAEPYRCPATNKNEYCKHDIISAFNNGAKWQAGRMYSEEDLIYFYNFIENHQLRKYGDVWRRITNDSKDKPLNFESVDDQYIIDWFEQFKKK
jgi:hypothetical protein